MGFKTPITYTVNGVTLSDADKYSVHVSSNATGKGNTAQTNAYPMELKVYAAATYVADETTTTRTTSTTATTTATIRVIA